MNFYYGGTNSANVMSLTGLGRVGIGTQSPASTLHIADLNNPAMLTLGVNATGGGYSALQMSLSSISNGFASLQAIRQAGSSFGDLILNKDGGNVGIGTIAPQSK